MSTELILLALLALISLVVGTVSVRDALVAEISDVAGAGQDLNQSFQFNGHVASSATTAGSSVTDATDAGDTPNDASDSVDNCITIRALPLDEGLLVSASELFTQFLFFDGAQDTSSSGQDNSGTLVGAEVAGGVAVFDGNDQIRIPNSPDINLGIHETRTIAVKFNPSNVTARQVIYEEGANVRGINIYIFGGRLYVGGWNLPRRESGWRPTYVSTPISAGTDYHVALVLDGGETVEPNGITGYLNGTAFGSAPGSQLWEHNGGISLGGINQLTIFHDIGVSNAPAGFIGTMTQFDLYDRALSATEVSTLP